MNCTICGKKIELAPSARERASKDVCGKSAAYYTGLFTEHPECALEKRKQDTVELCRTLGNHLPGMEHAVTL
jgi:hypothetical protein